MNTLQELVSHMKKFKDAVIIVGNDINSIKYDYTVNDFNENYNRKTLKRNPENLWKFFNENLLSEIDNNKIYDYIKELDYNLLVNQNINGPIDDKSFNIHGHINKFLCPKCKTIYTSNYIIDDSIPTCELCDSIIRPSILLTGERYDQTEFDNLKQNIIDTHTLFVIGLDYTEQPILDLIADYGDMKSQINADGDPEKEKTLVVIQDKDKEYDPNEIAFCDFLVKDNIENAMKRFIECYK